MILQIIISDGIKEQKRTLKSDVTLERAEELLEQMYNDDYLGLSYYLYVDCCEHLAFEN